MEHSLCLRQPCQARSHREELGRDGSASARSARRSATQDWRPRSSARALKCVSDCYREQAILIVLSEVLEIITSNRGDDGRLAKRLCPSSTTDADPDKGDIPLFESVNTEPSNRLDGSDVGKGNPATLAAASNVLLASDAVRHR